MFFIFWFFALGSCDLSQAEKEIIVCSAVQINIMTTILNQNGPMAMAR